MTAKRKIAHRKLSMLQLAERLNNVSEACRLMGYSRSQFYEIKRSFQLMGFEGLKDRPPIPKTVPHKTPAEVEEKVLALSLEHPTWGKQRVADHLRLQGVSLCAATVRNIWVRLSIETRYQRLLKLEEKLAGGEPIELTAEQIRLLERANPCWRERHVESRYPGNLLCQDTFGVGRMKGVGRLWLQVVVDTYGSYAFAKLYTSKLPITAVDLLYERVLPFYEARGLKIEAVLTDRGREFCGRPERHPYELFLELHDIEHRLCKVATPRTNGFVERFHRTALDEFFRLAFRKKLYLTVEELQADLDGWLKHYNEERPHQGYRNMGKRPIETIEEGKKLVPKKRPKKESKEAA